MEELSAYFYNNVFLEYHQYREIRKDPMMGQSKDRSAAINAATVLYHFREHIPESYRKTRTQLSEICPDFDLLGDIVNASKHKEISRGEPKVVNADDVYEILVSTTYRDSDGEYDDIEKHVEVKLIDGTVRDLYEILTSVVNLWHDELYQTGVIDRRDPIQIEEKGIVPRELASKNSGLSMTKGFQWKQHFRIQQYNYETNEIEAVDLSDAKELTFTIRKPQTFTIELADEYGEKITKSLELTPEQSIELSQISSPEKCNQFMLKLADEQGILDIMKDEYRQFRNENKINN